MRIEQLEYLLEVAKCRSISQAARNLFIGQSTLSAAISALENELQIDIFRRTHKGLSVTPLGDLVIEEAKAIVARAFQLKSLSLEKPNPHKSIHIVSYPAGCITVMVRVANWLYHHCPSVKFHTHESKPELLVKTMLSVNGNIGVGALSSVRLNTLRAEVIQHDLAVEVLYVDHFSLYVSTEHPLSHCENISLAEIIDEPLAVMRSWISPLDNVFYAEFQSFKNASSFSNYESIKKVVVENQMMSLSPSLGFYKDIYMETGKIKEIPVTDFNERLINFVISPKDKSLLAPMERDILSEIKLFYDQLVVR